MKAPQLETSDSQILLIQPDIERDPLISLNWLKGEMGRSTLSLMGVSDIYNKESSINLEQERIKSFIEDNSQLNWMIKLDDRIVGSIWVDLEPKETLPAPAIHIMIGDPNARGHGVGGKSTQAVINYLKQGGNKAVYSRRLVSNIVAKKLLDENGFQNIGGSYTDANGLEWQNVELNFQD